MIFLMIQKCENDEDVLELADASMKYYNELYLQRFQVHQGNTL